jgi:hypothetical protein
MNLIDIALKVAPKLTDDEYRQLCLDIQALVNSRVDEAVQAERPRSGWDHTHCISNHNALLDEKHRQQRRAVEAESQRDRYLEALKVEACEKFDEWDADFYEKRDKFDVAGITFRVTRSPDGILRKLFAFGGDQK